VASAEDCRFCCLLHDEFDDLSSYPLDAIVVIVGSDDGGGGGGGVVIVVVDGGGGGGVTVVGDGGGGRVLVDRGSGPAFVRFLTFPPRRGSLSI